MQSVLDNTVQQITKWPVFPSVLTVTDDMLAVCTCSVTGTIEIAQIYCTSFAKLAQLDV